MKKDKQQKAGAGIVAAGLSQRMGGVDKMLALIAECKDADVTFEPVDPEAHDPYAESAEEVELAWTLGHLIVHTTASAEESAALAAELARGVGFHGRSRSEIPWQEVTTVAQCRERLAESRRMRLASLGMWPARPSMTVGMPYRVASQPPRSGPTTIGMAM